MKYLILGAGPTALTFANRLKYAGISSFLIVEKEKEAGGLCRSLQIDGAPLDIGGGHFLDIRNSKVNNFLFRFMPSDEWNTFKRDSQISFRGDYIGHPFEANIWQMGISDQVEFLKSIAKSGSNIGKPMPILFKDWIKWKLGDKIADEYMIPYNQKIFGDELNVLGSYWLDKLPNVSFEDTLLSCLNRKAYGQQPGHTQFLYPKKFGYGELWKRMANELKDKIVYNSEIKLINYNQKYVEASDGTKYWADNIITTIPWNEFVESVGMPIEIHKDIKKLKHSSVQIEYYDSNIESNAHWIYYPEMDKSFHRILLRNNFCIGSKGHWTETNADRVSIQHIPGKYSYLNEYAYPLNTIDKPVITNKLLKWAKSKNVIGIGRWGEHQHYNSDKTVELALNMAESIVRLSGQIS